MADEEQKDAEQPAAAEPESKVEEAPAPVEAEKPAPAPEAKPAAEAKPEPASEAKPPDTEKGPEGIEAALAGDEVPAPGRRRGKSGKHVPVGVVFIKATFNNTLVSITDPRGNVVAWGSSGRSGFKGSRKSTAFAATVVSQDAARQAVSMGMQEVEVRVQGPGAGRESAIRALQSVGLSVTSIKDVTPIPHNGCRPPKRRRV